MFTQDDLYKWNQLIHTLDDMEGQERYAMAMRRIRDRYFDNSGEPIAEGDIKDTHK